MADDYPGDYTTTGSLPINGTVRGHIDSMDDQDWFRLNLQPGAAYLFSATATDGTEPMIYVFGKFGGPDYFTYSNNRAYSDGTALTTPYSWIDKDDYYLWVQSDHPVDYTVGVRRLADDHLNDASAAIALTVGSNIGAQLDYSGDEEYFRISATMGSTYKIRLAADKGVLPEYTTLQMTGKYGWADFSYTREGDAFILDLKADATRDYFVKVHTDPRETLGAPVKYHVSMTGNIRQLPPDDYADNAPSIVVPAGGSASARLDYAGDSEYFTFDAVAGLTYTVRVAADRGALPAKVALWRATVSSSEGPTPYLDNGALVIKVLAEQTGQLSVGVRADINTPLASPVAYHLSATAVDVTGPKLVEVTGSVDGGLKLSYNEQVQRGNDTIQLLNNAGKVIETWDMSRTPVTSDGKSFVIDPGHVLLPGRYVLRIGENAVKDLSGNASSTWDSTKSIELYRTADGGIVRPYYNNGGAGENDVGVVNGTIGGVKITRDGTITHVQGPDQSLVFDNVGRIMFTQSDEVIDFRPTSAVGQAFRMYQAAFDRAPDPSGLGFWLYQLQHTMSLSDVARGFLTSGEFGSRYGSNLSNVDFVNSLYHNVLHRDGDTGGFAFHVGTLDHGASRADVLTTFSESPENQAQVASLIGNGIVYTPYG